MGAQFSLKSINIIKDEFMDNSFLSQIKRGLKVTIDYLLILVLFFIFSSIALGFVKDEASGVMFVLSVIVFLILFYTVYVDMRIMAFKEKRPQYEINPSPFKGLLYGAIGSVPLVVIQVIIMLIKVPEEWATFQKRLYQSLGSPLYWLSRTFGNAPIHYLLSFVAVVLIAGIGYYAGYKEFYLVSFINKKLGIQKKVKKKVNKTK